jgi:hypothetical protein
VICQQVAAILLHLLKAFRRCHYLQVTFPLFLISRPACPQDPANTNFCGLSRSACAQAEYLARLVCDSNYLLLALKYLNQDCDTLLRLPDSVSAHASKHKRRAPVPRPTPLISCQCFRAQRPNGLSHFLINVL